MITEERLRELEALANSRTTDDWTWGGREVDDEGYVYIPQGSHLGDTLICLDDTYEDCARDCDFIAAAPTALAELIGDARESQAFRVQAMNLIRMVDGLRNASPERLVAVFAHVAKFLEDNP